MVGHVLYMCFLLHGFAWSPVWNLLTPVHICVCIYVCICLSFFVACSVLEVRQGHFFLGNREAYLCIHAGWQHLSLSMVVLGSPDASHALKCKLYASILFNVSKYWGFGHLATWVHVYLVLMCNACLFVVWCNNMYIAYKEKQNNL